MATDPPCHDYQHRKPSSRLCILYSRGSMAQVYLLVVKLWVRLVYKDRKLPMDRPQRAQTVACRHRYDPTSHPLATELGTVIRRLRLHLTTSSESRAAQPKASTCHNHSRTAAHLGAQIRSIPTPLDHHSRQHHRTREASVAQHQQQAQAARQ